MVRRFVKAHRADHGELRQLLAGEGLVRLVDVADLANLDPVALAEGDDVDGRAVDFTRRVALADRDQDGLDAEFASTEELLGDAADRADRAVGVDRPGHCDVGIQRVTPEKGEHRDRREGSGARAVDVAFHLGPEVACERFARQQRRNGDGVPDGRPILVTQASDLVLAEIHA